ncbi:His/Glu/Gln/Arg/opine family amino acid ABC transporter permease subunit [Pseudomonas sp. JAI120]|nr:His/Glu/Gln/Arg/opine family amino acid ABC transporter permease subunit [Pseudomonas sp. SJZ073]MBB6314998.1 His/Glu/Gln/Arg/opine family amino acid ABC transporter permease subunit [Pseudomonas sp. JAI120]
MASSGLELLWVSLPQLGKGAAQTLSISLLSIAFSTVGGVLYGVLRRLINAVLRVYLELFRAIPVLVWLYLLFFGLSIPSFWYAVLIVGVFTDKPPFGFVNEAGRYVGFDTDIGRQFAKDLLGDENKVEFVAVELASRIPFLQSDKVDLILANMTVTPERKELSDDTKPESVIVEGGKWQG